MLKKKTANRLKTFGALLLSMVMCLSLSFPAFAFSGTDTGDITISGAEKGLGVSVYQLMTVNIDDNGQPKDPVYSWVGAMQGWIDANYPEYEDANDFNTAADGGNVTDDKAKEFYDKLSVAVKGGLLTAAGTSTTDDGGAATLSGLTMGNYLILIENGMKVYRPSAVNLVPEWDDENEEWVMTSPAAVTLKSSEPGIDKEVNGEEKDETFIGDTVSYVITSTLPVYPDNATNKTYKVSDKLSAGLTLDLASMVVKMDGVTLTAGTEYSIATGAAESDPTFTATFDYDALVTKAGGAITGNETITVEYDAALNKDAVIGDTGNLNHAKLEYANNPYDNSSFKTHEKEIPVYTYGLDITKINKAEEPLEGAVFNLERKSGEKLYFVSEGAGNYYLSEQGASGATADLAVGTGSAAGKLILKGLDTGEYVLTEKTAPGGYNKLQRPIEVTITDDDLNGLVDEKPDVEQTSGYVSFTVTNTQGFELPVTGGRGTILFTVGGILLIGLAGVIFFTARKRKNG